MYYPINWPRIVRLPDLGGDHKTIRQVLCNRDKILVAVLSSDSLFILYNKPCVPVACWKLEATLLERHGENLQLEWKPDSNAIAVLTSKGYLSYYDLQFQPDQPFLYDQRDSAVPGLRRESAELYVKESVPPFVLKLAQTIPIESGGVCMVGIRDELMITTKYGHVLRYGWTGTLNRDYCLDLRRIPFCVDQLAARAEPITEPNTFITRIDYSPLLGGFAVVLNNGRAAFLTASTLKFDPNQVQGIWAPMEDITSTAINHRYRLMAFGRRNSHADVFSIDETTGGLQLSHTLQLSSRDYPGPPGPVQLLQWSPDGCCLALCWTNGGISLWSTFGALLLCTLNWDFGAQGPAGSGQLSVRSLDWGIEGYQLWIGASNGTGAEDLMQMELVKSPLTANPCMSSKERLYLHGQDRVYINISDAQQRVCDPISNSRSNTGSGGVLQSSSKQWLVVQAPNGYTAGNWPLRFASLDSACENLAVAGRTGFALYSFLSRRWKLFGNESQERDFVVAGGLLWWRQYLILGCYNIGADRDEIRLYPRDATRLDNAFCTIHQVAGQILLLSLMGDSLLVYTSDCHITLFELETTASLPERPTRSSSSSLPIVNVTAAQLTRTQEIDVSTLGLHPACLVAASLTSLSHNEPHRAGRENILLNVCGRVLLIQRGEGEDEGGAACYAAPTVLASSVEILWVPNPSGPTTLPRKPHLTQALWLCCGSHGMRVWLPLYPRVEGTDGHSSAGLQHQHHAFMSKRIMLPFQLHIYPLSVLFEEAVLLGVETDTLLYPSAANGSADASQTNPWLSPFCVLERNSQVYLHQIFRQLIRRNLGFHAWEIARGCTHLPYFSHSLELLLHEVLEEEATSKDPIPDALLPSVLEFIREFPASYLATVVQCARKTEVALWPYLFQSAAVNPRHLFQQCLDLKQLDLAASYLIILQNMEPVTVSRQHATILLDAALEQCSWDLAKDLVRFLRAIDPSEAETAVYHPIYSTTPTSGWPSGAGTSKSSSGLPAPLTLAGCAPSPAAGALLPTKISLGSQTPPVSPNPDDFTFLLGSTVHRPGRVTPSGSAGPSGMKSPNDPRGHREIVRSASDSSKSVAGASGNRQAETKSAVGSQKGNRKKSAPVNSNPIMIGATGGPEDSADQLNNSTGDPSVEELFLDVILQRHVRRLLSAGRLKDLGYLGAHFDCPLVAWLGRERMRAARVDDFVSATRRIHAEFNWPYPSVNHLTPYGSTTTNRRLSSSSARGVSLEEKLQALEVDVTPSVVPVTAPYLGALKQQQQLDSGYLSNASNGTPVVNGAGAAINKMPPVGNGGGLLLQMVEAQLKPHTQSKRADEEWSVTSEADQISLAGELERFTCNDVDGQQYESSWTAHCMAVQENSTNQFEVKGNAQSELQLRYLLQLFTEADCLDWALVLALVLRDAMAVLRLVSMARSSLTSATPGLGQANTIEIVTRLRDGLLALSHWVDTECQGYRQFMNVIYGQIGTLTKLILPGTPKTPDCGPFFPDLAAGNSSSSNNKSRHSSVTLMTPLNSVEEEVSNDSATRFANGKLTKSASSIEVHRSEQKMIRRDPSKSMEPVQQQQEPQPQMQTSTSCVIC